VLQRAELSCLVDDYTAEEDSIQVCVLYIEWVGLRRRVPLYI
jgi:hypothetical protein